MDPYDTFMKVNLTPPYLDETETRIWQRACHKEAQKLSLIIVSISLNALDITVACTGVGAKRLDVCDDIFTPTPLCGTLKERAQRLVCR